MFKSILSLLLLVIVLSSCGPLGSAQDRANAAIDDALKRLDRQSSSWQEVLSELVSKLTEAGQSTIRSEVENTLRRSVGETGTQVQCSLDFIGDRVKEDLRQIRAGLTGKKIIRHPKLCQVVPSAMDMNLEPNRRNLITFNGYNFDSEDGVHAFLIERLNAGDARIDVSMHLRTPTHYQMTLNLGSNGVQLTSSSQSIILESRGQSLSGISVIQPLIPQCQSRVEGFSVSPRTYVPPHTRGDKEFFGKVNMQVKVSLHIQEGKLLGQIYMKAEQPDDDHTTAEGTDSWDTGYIMPQGWRLDSILSPTTDEFAYFDKTWEVDVFQRGGLVDRYEFIGDTSTDEAGTKTKATVFFNAAQLRLAQIANCRP